MLNKNTYQYHTDYENTNMHYVIFFNYPESGTQVSDMLNMSQFHQISLTKCSHRETTE